MNRAIARSISHTEIAHVHDVNAAQLAYLTELGDGYSDTTDREGQPMREVWGTTGDGAEWRVHAHRSEGA